MSRQQPSSRLQGLYVITDSALLSDDQQLLHGVAAAIDGGACLVQYRDKSNDQQKRLRQSKMLLQLCRERHVPLLINDDLSLAAEVGADGVHLGRGDGSLQAARALLGEQAIIGLSCYNQLNLAEQAQQEGANYVAFGRFFNSQTKPQAPSVAREFLVQAKQKIYLPIVAIGGITPQNGGSLVAAGVDMLAVVHGVFSSPDIQATAQNYKQLFSE
ncbi:MAG: thiamine phosphate synthase [Gammaproteobacteria bacterium]|nr:thiamine phosphate synthase [Gammaproteobacteria bacterium]MCF6230589.1 thiamine phosphate synthase [Gammaproteobacteria bacterium]